ncbi:glycosyltransferase family 2 protein [Chryseobacterium sp. YR221]|uniref:glycosyltransferase family 2 protein n=1 Tax=Chryseobacterium sp. YR221 TaxID=1500293 RepID=UPI0009D7FBC4|nr:glycosyltransferase [Chryseobacterium sp. YR221]SMC47917.1 Glycosyltransferase involved in cell wall bisynthesis [Chryseobacterium sp. YR221]
MNDNILVSIAIPMFNAEKFLKFTLNSILNQSHTNFELIITDDGSTDKSVEIVKSFNDSRIKLYVDGLNKGISYRLNQQIDLVKGKYFIRMDADDIMFSNRLEKQIDFLENNPDVDVVGSSAVIIGDLNEVIGFRLAQIPPSYEDALKTITFIHPTVAGKTEWFKKYKYDEELIGAEDFDLWLRSRENSVFKIIEEPLLFYRDPLKFKLKTYLFRLKQQRKIFRKNPYLTNHPFKQKKMILTSYLKSNLALLINTVGLDNYYIARRNKTLAGNIFLQDYNDPLLKSLAKK